MPSVKWKDGFRTKVSPTVAWRFFERVRAERDGELDLELAVQWSKPKDAPLHGEIEWNDKKLAESARRDQMRRIVRNLVEVRPRMKSETRVYEQVRVEMPAKSPDKKPEVRNVFRSTEEILADPAGRADLLGQAVRDALAFRRRYAALAELATLIRAIDETVENLG